MGGRSPWLSGVPGPARRPSRRKGVGPKHRTPHSRTRGHRRCRCPGETWAGGEGSVARQATSATPSMAHPTSPERNSATLAVPMFPVPALPPRRGRRRGVLRAGRAGQSRDGAAGPFRRVPGGLPGGTRLGHRRRLLGRGWDPGLESADGFDPAADGDRHSRSGDPVVRGMGGVPGVAPGSRLSPDRPSAQADRLRRGRGPVDGEPVRGALLAHGDGIRCDGEPGGGPGSSRGPRVVLHRARRGGDRVRPGTVRGRGLESPLRVGPRDAQDQPGRRDHPPRTLAVFLAFRVVRLLRRM